MDDLYQILGCDLSSSADEIRKKYKTLAHRHHPDNHSTEEKLKQHQIFSDITRAYRILSDDQLRYLYNSRYEENKLMQELPVQQQIEFHDLERIDGGYVFPCRCGDEFSLTDLDVDVRLEFASCPSCSLCLKIDYPHRPAPDNLEKLLPGGRLPS